MSNNNDERAWAMSLPSPYPNHGQQAMLTGDRFSFDANQVYRMPADNWEVIKDDPVKVAELVQKYITDHYRLQVPRIITLERYYNGDNDIHYWASHKAPTGRTTVSRVVYRATSLTFASATSSATPSSLGTTIRMLMTLKKLLSRTC